eukprot:c18308_g1_i1 orf=118-339(-)
MVLLGTVRHHSAVFYFSWQLYRTVATKGLWSARNSLVSSRKKGNLLILQKTVLLRLEGYFGSGRVKAMRRPGN